MPSVVLTATGGPLLPKREFDQQKNKRPNGFNRSGVFIYFLFVGLLYLLYPVSE